MYKIIEDTATQEHKDVLHDCLCRHEDTWHIPEYCDVLVCCQIPTFLFTSTVLHTTQEQNLNQTHYKIEQSYSHRPSKLSDVLSVHVVLCMYTCF